MNILQLVNVLSSGFGKVVKTEKKILGKDAI